MFSLPNFNCVLSSLKKNNNMQLYSVEIRKLLLDDVFKYEILVSTDAEADNTQLCITE